MPEGKAAPGRLPRSTASRIGHRLLLGVAAFLVAGVLFCFHTGFWICERCGSARTTTTMGLGLDGARPWLPFIDSERVRPSAAFSEFLDAGHEHRWGHMGSREHNLVCRGYIACGGVRLHAVAHAYEFRPAFRELVRKRIAAGSLTLDDVRGLLALDPRVRWEDEPRPEPRRLMARANELLRDSGEERGARQWQPER